MPIPSGTKFHGVAPGVDTENRGSANANADRDAYTIEEFNGSFKGWMLQSPQPWDRVVTLSYNGGSYPVPSSAPAGAVPVTGSFGPTPYSQYKSNFFAPVGIVKAGAPFSESNIVNVVVQGLQSPATLFCEFGVTPKAGDTLYAGGGGIITCGNADLGDYFSIGTVTGTNPVKIIDYAEYGGVWEVEAYYSFSAQSPYYIDGIAYKSSVRQPCSVRTDLDVELGDIVKIGINTATSSSIYVERVSSSDPVESFVGIVADERATPGTLPTDVPPPNSQFAETVCMSGNVFIPAWVINGADPVRGGLIYADATTPYKLTTDSTSGTVIGLVQTLTFDENGAIERVLIQVKL